jgi:PAS domain S-box-containing protein
MTMAEEQPIQSLADVIAHSNVLIQRGRELDQKLVAMELLMSRYQASHAVALLFSQVDEKTDALLEFVNYLVLEMNFQKAGVLRVAKDVALVTQRGFTSAEVADFTSDQGAIRTALAGDVQEQNAIEGAALIDLRAQGADKGKRLFGLVRYLIGRAKDGDDELVIFAGFDDDKGALYENKYPLAEDDVFWFSQLVLLCISFLDKMRLFNALKQKAAENMILAEEREKQIEERTRALLDALFDAKKFRLVIERADMLVALIDSASHRFIFVNTLWERFTGFPRDSIIGKKTFEALSFEPLEHLEKQPKLFSAEFEMQIQSDGFSRGTFVSVDPTGSERAVSLSFSRFDDDAGGMLYVIIGRDISEDRERSARERARIEEVEKLNQLMINRELRIIELKQQLMPLSRSHP